MSEKPQTLTVVVMTAKVPAGATREQSQQAFESTKPYYAGFPAIRQKYYTYSAEDGLLGSVYIWDSREAALEFFHADWKAQFAAKWGPVPTVTVYEALAVLRPERL